MVIIARELAVTGLRAVAVEQGVVISASWLGKLKTMLQVGAVFALIIWNPSPTWVDVLVYLAVAVTVISGADYFFGLRRRVEEERVRRSGCEEAPERASGSARCREPRATRARSCGGASARRSRARRRSRPAARSAPRTRSGGGSSRGSPGGRGRSRRRAAAGSVVGHSAHHLAHAVLDEARVEVRLLDHRDLVGALHELVDLRAHRLLDDVQRSRASTSSSTPLGPADVKRADPALVVGGDRDGGEHALDLVVGESLGGEPLPRAPGRPAPARTDRRSCPGPRRRSGCGCRARRRRRCRAACRSPGWAGRTRASCTVSG